MISERCHRLEVVGTAATRVASPSHTHLVYLQSPSRCKQGSFWFPSTKCANENQGSQIFQIVRVSKLVVVDPRN